MINMAVLIKDGVVVDIAVVAEELPAGMFDETHPGCIVVYADSEETNVGIGDTYDGKVFTRPEYIPTPEEQLDMDRLKLERETVDANYQVTLLIDATDPDIVDEVDPADVELLKAWKRYRLALSKVDINNPVWPVRPA